jgi:hypothetical protein
MEKVVIGEMLRGRDTHHIVLKNKRGSRERQ